MCANQIEQPRGMGFKNRATMTANLVRRRSTVNTPLPDPFDGAAGLTEARVIATSNRERRILSRRSLPVNPSTSKFNRKML
jgi:hypothetical protein